MPVDGVAEAGIPCTIRPAWHARLQIFLAGANEDSEPDLIRIVLNKKELNRLVLLVAGVTGRAKVVIEISARIQGPVVLALVEGRRDAVRCADDFCRRAAALILRGRGRRRASDPRILFDVDTVVRAPDATMRNRITDGKLVTAFAHGLRMRLGPAVNGPKELLVLAPQIPGERRRFEARVAVITAAKLAIGRAELRERRHGRVELVTGDGFPELGARVRTRLVRCHRPRWSQERCLVRQECADTRVADRNPSLLKLLRVTLQGAVRCQRLGCRGRGRRNIIDQGIDAVILDAVAQVLREALGPRSRVRG